MSIIVPDDVEPVFGKDTKDAYTLSDKTMKVFEDMRTKGKK
jgi:hypothetical protein